MTLRSKNSYWQIIQKKKWHKAKKGFTKEHEVSILESWDYTKWLQESSNNTNESTSLDKMIPKILRNQKYVPHVSGEVLGLLVLLGREVDVHNLVGHADLLQAHQHPCHVGEPRRPKHLHWRHCLVVCLKVEMYNGSMPLLIDDEA
jgi:hypothetical protein